MSNFFTDQLPLAAFVHQLLYNFVFVNRSCFIAYHILDILTKRVCSIEGKTYSRKKDLFQNRITGRRNTLVKTFFEEIFLKKNSRGEFPTKKSGQRHSPFLTYARYHFTDFRIHIIITQLLLPLRLEGEETLK